MDMKKTKSFLIGNWIDAFPKEKMVKIGCLSAKLAFPVLEHYEEPEEYLKPVFSNDIFMKATNLVLNCENGINICEFDSILQDFSAKLEELEFSVEETSGDRDIVKARYRALNSIQTISYALKAVAWTPESVVGIDSHEVEEMKKAGPRFEVVMAVQCAIFALNINFDAFMNNEIFK